MFQKNDSLNNEVEEYKLNLNKFEVNLMTLHNA